MPEEEKKKTAKEALKDLSKPLDGSTEVQEEETQRKWLFCGNTTSTRGLAPEKLTWYAITYETKPSDASDYDAVYDSASGTYIKLGQTTKYSSEEEDEQV